MLPLSLICIKNKDKKYPQLTLSKTATEYYHLSICFVFLGHCITLTSACTEQMCWAGTCHSGTLANKCRPARYKKTCALEGTAFLINDALTQSR